jgi:hypothetical protein
MDSCIQNYAVPKKERDLDNTVLSLRLTSAEAARFWRLMDQVKSRSPYIGKSDVVRELLGLIAPAALTRADIDFFRTGNKAAPKGITVPPASPSPDIPLINHKDLERRNTSAVSKKKKTKRVA